MDQNITDIILVRCAILGNGLKVEPTLLNIAEMARAQRGCTPEKLDVTAFENWWLYKACPEWPCDLHCISANDWLVTMLCQYTKDPDYPLHRVDPAVWTIGIVDYWNSMPVKGSKRADQVVAEIQEAAMKVSEEDWARIRGCIERKARAIAEETNNSNTSN